MTKLGGKLYLIEYKNHKIDQMAQMVNPYTTNHIVIIHVTPIAYTRTVLQMYIQMIFFRRPLNYGTVYQ